LESSPNNSSDRLPLPSAYGDHLASRFWLKQPKSHVASSLTRGVLAVTQIKSAFPTPQPSQPIGYDNAYLVGLMVEDVPDHQLWQDGRAVKTEAFPAGHTALFDLRRDPINYTRTAHHSLHFYLPHAALLELAERDDLTFSGELRYRFATSYDDAVVRQLGMALLPALERNGGVNGLFVDHVLHALACHVLGRYGETSPLRRALTSGQISPWQINRAKELMRARLDSDVSLKDLATACGISITHFTRGFRRSTGISPHRWLVERRIERAKGLLIGGNSPLSDIAVDCGFADQSHFTRTFRHATGISPGRWRRLHAAGPRRS
jgi:AraC-like DNA-binding protein